MILPAPRPSSPPIPPPPVADAPWSTTRVVAVEGLEALRDEWDELLAASPADGLFLSWEWLSCWWRHLGAGRELALVAVRRGDRLAAVAPLARGSGRWRFAPPAVGLLGTGTVGSDYLDVVARAGEELRATERIADQLERRPEIVELAQLERGRTSAALLTRTLERRGWRSLARPTGICPWIDLAGRSWEEYVADLGASHRANLRRRTRKLERRYRVEFQEVTNARELPAALAELVRLHRLRWRPRGGSDGLEAPELIAFHQDFARAALDRGWLRLYLLRLDGEPAAALYGFRYGGRFLFYQSGFDPRFADDAVGMICMARSIRAAIEEGAQEYDLLHGDEPYKFLWADRRRQLERIELFPPTAAARLEHGRRRLVRAAKDCLRPWRDRALGAGRRAAVPARSTDR